MLDEVTVRQYRPDDETGIIELLDLVFDGWPSFDLKCTKKEHWKWKFKDNPNGNQNIAVCTNGSDIVGCLQDFPTTIKIQDRIAKCGNALDAAVHPDYRKRGIYSKMIKLIDKARLSNNTNFVSAFTSNPILMAHSTYPVFPSPLQMLIRMHDVDLHIKMKGTDVSYIKKMGYIRCT